MSFLNFFRRSKKTAGTAADDFFKEKYQSFKKLLAANNDVLEIMSRMEAKLEGDFIFDMQYIRSRCTTILAKVQTIIHALNLLGEGQYADLQQVFEDIEKKIKSEIATELPSDIIPLVFPLTQVDRQVLPYVGGKNANLGEIKNLLHAPTPDGFVISNAAYRLILEENLISDTIAQQLEALDTDNLVHLEEQSQALRRMILEAEIPARLQDEITWHYRKLTESLGYEPLLALRSSGVEEDQEFSCAGQFQTLLNIPFARIFPAYLEVLASQFSPQALVYLKSKQLLRRSISMSVGCLAMFNARSSGVLFTTDPLGRQTDAMVIEAAWGLGLTVVGGGLTPDRFILTKNPPITIQERHIHPKPIAITVAPGEGLAEDHLPPAQANAPALADQEVLALAEFGQKLEDHFGGPQDIEFAIDAQGHICLLQTRPLTFLRPEPQPDASLSLPTQAPVILDTGTVACFGVAAGPVFIVRCEADLQDFPDGAVLVARHTTSRYGAVLHKASAMLIDIGSATSHLAILAREFKVPALVDTQRATALLHHGQEITVDANRIRVYAGRVDELLQTPAVQSSLLQETPLYRKLRRVLKWVTPLNLTDPKLSTFAPQHCRTLHDITRFCHQMAIKEMFELGEKAGLKDFHTYQVKTPIPFNLHVIDLGGGIQGSRRGRFIPPEALISIPMQALWRGISHPDISWAGPIPIDVKGLYSVVSRSLTAASPQHADFWTRTLAIVSEHYLNFNSRLGYHFATIDAFVSDTRNENYITFRFKGGAADETRRGRRARFLGAVMSRLDFEVEVTGDLIVARLWKYPRSLMEEKLDLIGRLMGAARQRDMLMADDAIVEWYVEAFLAGNYRFEGEPGSQESATSLQ